MTSSSRIVVRVQEDHFRALGRVYPFRSRQFVLFVYYLIFIHSIRWSRNEHNETSNRSDDDDNNNNKSILTVKLVLRIMFT